MGGVGLFFYFLIFYTPSPVCTWYGGPGNNLVLQNDLWILDYRLGDSDGRSVWSTAATSAASAINCWLCCSRSHVLFVGGSSGKVTRTLTMHPYWWQGHPLMTVRLFGGRLQLIVVLVQRVLVYVQIKRRCVLAGLVLRAALRHCLGRGRHHRAMWHSDVVARIGNVVWSTPLCTTILEPCLDLEGNSKESISVYYLRVHFLKIYLPVAKF